MKYFILILLVIISAIQTSYAQMPENSVGLSYNECQKQILDEMEKTRVSIDISTAISVALKSPEFQSKVKDYNYTYSGMFSNMTWNDSTCNNVNLKDVTVSFSLFNQTGGFEKFIQVDENKDLTKIIKIRDVFLEICNNNCPLPEPPPLEFLILSPLKQIKSGISSQQVSCKDGLELVVKSSNNSPVCVKPETKIKLIERGWTQISEAKHLSSYSNKFPNIEERNIQVNVGEIRVSQTGLSVMVLEKDSRSEPSRSIMFQQVTPSYSGSFDSDDVLYNFFKVSSGEGEENITETYYDTPISNTVIAGNDKEYFSVYFPIEIPLKSSVQNSIIQFNYSLPYITPDFDQKYSFGLVSLSPLTINLPDDAKLIRSEISTPSNFWFFDKSGGELSHMTDGYMLYYGSLNPPIKIQNLIVYKVEFELDAKK